MKISRLEIFGFKSFLERVVLPIDQGITAIVGPNGCGKSNIVDALRWVFGETRAHQLRGALLEDVIFNGTETLRPLGLAEVSLVISTEKKSLYEDIVATKRQSEAETKAAFEEQELKDVDQDSHQDNSESTESGSARPRLVVIEGALSPRSLERAAEAAEAEIALSVDSVNIEHDPKGVDAELESEFKSKAPAEAALPPEASSLEEDPALARLSWLKLSREVEVTRRLYRSGESEFFINKVACRLRDLKDLFRLLGLGARSYTLVAQGEVSRIITSKPEERRLMIEEAAGVSGVRERLAAAEKRLDDTKGSLVRLNDLLVEVTRQVNSLRVQATRAKNRAELRERLQFLDLSVIGHRMQTFVDRGESLERDLQGLVAHESNAKQQLDVLLSAEEGVQRQLVEYNTRREVLSQQIRRGRAELAARQAQRSALESESVAIEQQIKSKVAHSEELSQRAEMLSEQFSNAQEELEQFNSTLSQLQESIHSLESSSTEELQQASQALEDARSSYARADASLQEARNQAHGLSARIDALDEQLESQKQVLSESSANHQTRQAIASLSPLLRHVYAPAEFRKALEVAIDNFAEAQVCSDISEFVTRLIASADLSETHANLRVLSLFPQAGSKSPAMNLPPEIDGFALLSKLEITPEYMKLFEQVLGNVFVCENLQQVIPVIGQFPDLVFVTNTGELISSDRFSLFRSSAGPVELYAKRRDLVLEVEQSKEVVTLANAERERTHQALARAEDNHAAALQRSVESQQEIRKLTSELGAIRGKIEVISRLVTQISQDREALNFTLGNDQSDQATLSARLQELKMMLEFSSEGEVSIDQETLDQLEEQLEEINMLGKEVIDSLEERSRARDQARFEFEEITAQRSRAEFELEKITLERQSTEARLHDLYPEVAALSLLGQTALSAEDQLNFSEEAERLRSRISREGEVDPSSIALFEAEEFRLEELKAQKADLESAEKTLGETVLQLRELARKRFLETFKIVQRNFGRLIPRVFGGGFGSLQLENPEDPFEGGLDITVRPPGKRPKSIELLSGGERALCAIALIFSMFMHRPSPLCVLDEVDAPLDEANLRRYLTMVREMSSATQFLMISHNKESMAAADRLVGVTQDQPGASRVVTVSLEQAQAQVA